jgi:DNA topoisomerase I
MTIVHIARQRTKDPRGPIAVAPAPSLLGHSGVPSPARVKRLRRTPPTPIVSDPVESARAAGLRYVTDQTPGIRRQRSGKGFVYVDPDGRRLRDAEELLRIKRLAIPPAWRDVWICRSANGHIQASARDARGRKQYRYHPRWRQVRDDTKYTRMIAFAGALPRIRDRVECDLARSALPREKVLAAVVRLLEVTQIRVGNSEYARENGSYGLTTLREHHVDVSGHTLRFRFRGKSGKEHAVDLADRRLARIVKQCQELPGQELFQYIDDDGTRRTIDSADVNAYLREISGDDFTAKEFRTWAGTVLAALALQEFEKFDSATQAKKNVIRAIEAVAKVLGNTPAISRKCYVHPAIVEAYMDGVTLRRLKAKTEQRMRDALRGLRPEEAAVLALLQQRLTREVERLPKSA